MPKSILRGYRGLAGDVLFARAFEFVPTSGALLGEAIGSRSLSGRQVADEGGGRSRVGRSGNIALNAHTHTYRRR